MPEFEYSLGQVVLLDPFGSKYATKGIVIGRIEWIGGGMPGYYVSTRNAVGDEIKRHTVAECEISPLPLDAAQADVVITDDWDDAHKLAGYRAADPGPYPAPNDITVTGRYPHPGPYPAPVGEIPVGIETE